MMAFLAGVMFVVALAGSFYFGAYCAYKGMMDKYDEKYGEGEWKNMMNDIGLKS